MFSRCVTGKSLPEFFFTARVCLSDDKSSRLVDVLVQSRGQAKNLRRVASGTQDDHGGHLLDVRSWWAIIGRRRLPSQNHPEDGEGQKNSDWEEHEVQIDLNHFRFNLSGSVSHLEPCHERMKPKAASKGPEKNSFKIFFTVQSLTLDKKYPLNKFSVIILVVKVTQELMFISPYTENQKPKFAKWSPTVKKWA